MTTVQLAPFPTPGHTGGVMVHCRALVRHLEHRGWTVTADPVPGALVHTHAVDRAPVVDVYTNHGIYPITAEMPQWQRDANRRIFDNLKTARRVIAVSEWTAAQWKPLTGIIPHIIPNGVDLDDWEDVPRGYWRGRLEAGSKPIILWGKQGVSDVLDPAPAIGIALQRPDVIVVAPMRASVLRTAPPNFRMTGPLSFENMQRLLADCDIYLATVQENHSIQVLEAMALEKPILGYRWGGTAETITSGVDGILVEPGDIDGLVAHIDMLLAEDGQNYGKAARETVADRFQWSHQIDKTLEVYAEALDERQEERRPGRPVCSIVIPVYNKAPYVAEAIRSALTQVNAPPYEVIVVDDGSTDSSPFEIRRALDGARIKTHFIQQRNAGVAAARNHGISVAKGKYIACLDADDRIDPLFLSRLSAALDSDPTLGIAYSDFCPFGIHNNRHWQGYVQCSEYSFEKLKGGNFIPCCNLFRRVAWERAGGYKDINPSWEDYELWLNMGKMGWRGHRINQPLFYYRKLQAEGRDHESQGQERRLRAVVNSYHRDLYPPLVSVVIPCYQHSAMLPEAIESALAQTLPDLEVVVVDDGNEDQEATAIQQVVNEYAERGVRLIIHDRNRGLATARNSGVHAAQGQWIVPLDADDKIAPIFLEKCFAAIQSNPRLFAYTDSWVWWTDRDEIERIEAEEYDFEQMLTKITWPCTILYHKDAWKAAKGYKDRMSKAGGWEDWEFVITLGELGICGVRVPEPLFYYRQHSNNQMRYGAVNNKAALQEVIRQLHPRTVRGDFPMGCCGGGGRAPAAVPSPTRTVAVNATNGASGGIPVRYVGGQTAPVVWRGQKTGYPYEFGLASPLNYVHPDDVEAFLRLPTFIKVEA